MVEGKCEGQRKECGKKRIRRNAGRQCEGMREGCAKESKKLRLII